MKKALCFTLFFLLGFLLIINPSLAADIDLDDESGDITVQNIELDKPFTIPVFTLLASATEKQRADNGADVKMFFDAASEQLISDAMNNESLAADGENALRLEITSGRNATQLDFDFRSTGANTRLVSFDFSQSSDSETYSYKIKSLNASPFQAGSLFFDGIVPQALSKLNDLEITISLKNATSNQPDDDESEDDKSEDNGNEFIEEVDIEQLKTQITTAFANEDDVALEMAIVTACIATKGENSNCALDLTEDTVKDLRTKLTDTKRLLKAIRTTFKQLTKNKQLSKQDSRQGIKSLKCAFRLDNRANGKLRNALKDLNKLKSKQNLEAKINSKLERNYGQIQKNMTDARQCKSDAIKILADAGIVTQEFFLGL